MNDFSDVLKYLRQRAGMSQEELGGAIGVSKSTISMYECGRRKPSYEMLEAIADCFNVNIDMLAGRQDIHPTGDNDFISDAAIRMLHDPVFLTAVKRLYGMAPDKLASFMNLFF